MGCQNEALCRKCGPQILIWVINFYILHSVLINIHLLCINKINNCNKLCYKVQWLIDIECNDISCINIGKGLMEDVVYQKRQTLLHFIPLTWSFYCGEGHKTCWVLIMKFMYSYLTIYQMGGVCMYREEWWFVYFINYLICLFCFCYFIFFQVKTKIPFPTAYLAPT